MQLREVLDAMYRRISGVLRYGFVWERGGTTCACGGGLAVGAAGRHGLRQRVTAHLLGNLEPFFVVVAIPTAILAVGLLLERGFAVVPATGAIRNGRDSSHSRPPAEVY
jgi:hypothetical protein